MLQEGVTGWIRENPLIYFPWELSFVTNSTQYQLLDHKDQLQRKYAKRVERIKYLQKHYSSFQRWYKHWNNLWKTTKTADNKVIDYFELFPNIEELSAEMSSNHGMLSFQCYMLSLFNPLKPHLRPISCHTKIAETVICEKPSNAESNRISIPRDYGVQRYGLMHCSNGQFVSTFFVCDGYNDCFDGSDEKNCSCISQTGQINNSIYCFKSCTRHSNCTCAPLFEQVGASGCHTHMSRQDIKVLNPRKHQPRLIQKYLCKDSTVKINSKFLDDLLFDCPHQDDENELQSLPSEKIPACQEKNMHRCYPGHSECHTTKQKCIYNLTAEAKTLMYCRNGKHLQHCESEICLWMFKCPDSYCIPYRYFCDGKWDCWNGEDETACQNSSHKNMFKCRQHSIHIHTKNVCDGTFDCPLNDDEVMCAKLSCFPGCTCLNYGTSCERLNLCEKEYMLNNLRMFVFINITKSNFPQHTTNEFVHTATLIAQHNDLRQPFVCGAPFSKNHIRVLDLSFNKIAGLGLIHFSCLPELVQFNTNENEIANIAGKLSESLPRLRSYC